MVFTLARRVTRGAKTLTVLAALPLAVGLAACGGGDDSNSTATEVSGGQTSSNGSEGAGAKSEAKGRANAENGTGGKASSREVPADFKPKRHNDSGGGAEQFLGKGADNTVQKHGHEANQDEFEEVAAALHNFLDARAQGNWTVVCAYLTNQTTTSFEELAASAKEVDTTGCAEVLVKVTNPAADQGLRREAKLADVGSVRIEGESAFVIYRAGDRTIRAMPMKREDGGWKVSGLTPVPLN